MKISGALYLVYFWELFDVTSCSRIIYLNKRISPFTSNLPQPNYFLVDFFLCFHVDAKQDGRPPPAYFPPSNFARERYLLERWKRLFLRNTIFSKFLYFFEIEEFSDFCKKMLNSGWKKIFLWKISFDTHCTEICHLQPFFDKKKLIKLNFFQEKFNISFQKKTNFVRNREISYFSRILRQSCWIVIMKIFQIQNSRTSDIFNSDINSRQKKFLSVRVEWIIFLPYYKCGGN